MTASTTEINPLRSNSDLAVVMPVYNEEGSLSKVVQEWLPALKGVVPNFQMLILDDGSTDKTPAVIRELIAKNGSYLATTRHPNRGHGQSCIRGYQLAIAANARFILQIDSDGQCDPKYLGKFWERSNAEQAVFGTRMRRDDGIVRFLISFVVTWVVFLASGKWIRDPNVPYRLMRADVLQTAVQNFPTHIYLANIALSVKIATICRIRWIPIRFRDRFAGTPKVKLPQFAKHGSKLWRDLRRM